MLHKLIKEATGLKKIKEGDGPLILRDKNDGEIVVLTEHNEIRGLFNYYEDQQDINFVEINEQFEIFEGTITLSNNKIEDTKADELDEELTDQEYKELAKLIEARNKKNSTKAKSKKK